MARKNLKFAQSLQAISSMLTQQISTGINKTRVVTHPITTGQDLNLKTAYLTLDQYEKGISKLAYECSDFIDLPNRPSFQDFIETFSSIDKQQILLAIYDITYKGTFGEQQITCPCGKNVFKDEIKVSEVIQNDSFFPFDKTVTVKNKDGEDEEVEVSFKDYEFPITIELDRNRIRPATDIRFITYIPPISKTIELFKQLTREEIVERLKTINMSLTATDELTLITKRMELVIHKVDEEGNEKLIIETEDDPEAIYMTIKNFTLEKDVEYVQKQYDEHFRKYAANLRKPYQCGFKDKEGKECGHEFDFPVDIEVVMHNDFFRS